MTVGTGGWREGASAPAGSEAQRLARAILDAAPVALLAVDGAGAIAFASPQWAELCGADPGQLTTWSELSARLFGARAAEATEALAQGGARIELDVATAGDDQRIFLFETSALDAGGGAPLRILAATDVTDYRRRQDALAKADEQKNEFLAVLGHELRNPLSVVRTTISLLELVPSTAPILEQARSILRRQTQHIARLLDGLLDVSRIARGKLTLERETLDLCEVLRNVLRDRASQIESRALSAEISLPDEAIWIAGDRSRLVQVFDNLLSNAIKFTPRGGRIAVETVPKGGRVSVAVRDTGVGISQDFLGAVFEPFQQAPRSLSHAAGGLGLGLALVQKVVELHGGEVAVHSDGPDRGTEVRVELARAGAPEAAVPTLPPRARPRRILLVEDNRDHAALLDELLRHIGHQVRTCLDAADALACADEFRPEVVLCDIGLPGDMDGYQLAAALRQRHATAGAALIALTGYAGADTQSRSRAAGFDAQLTKPVDVDAIEAVLAELG